MIEESWLRRVEAHLGTVLDLPGLCVRDAETIAAPGLSRKVVSLTATAPGLPGPARYALMLESAASPLSPNRRKEFAILRALARVEAVPTAPALWQEEDPEPLGSAFLLTGFLPGGADPRPLLDPDRRALAETVARQGFAISGRIAGLDWRGMGLGADFEVPAAADVWQIELERWERALAEAGATDLVVTAAALRRLRRAPPPPSSVAIVHGDYRVGNYLFDDKGITGILDWEMVHLGDPLEDLAWALLPNWEFAARPGLASGILARDEAVAEWERASGLATDPAALRWWTLLAHVKATAIWAGVHANFARGEADDMRTALVSYGRIERQELRMIPLLKDDAR